MQTSSRSTSQKSSNWHKKIAKNRGDSWRKNMLAGRRDAVLNPSVLRLIRIKEGIHQDEIASKIKISESTYGAIERGKRMVSAEDAKAIASVFRLPFNKIFKFVKHDKYVAVIIKSGV